MTYMSRGTSFNPSSLFARAIGRQIKAQVWKNIQVSSPPSQSRQYDEKLCLDIIKYAEYSLSTLKDQILTTQLGPSRRTYVFHLPTFFFMSFPILITYMSLLRTTRILSAYVDDKEYSVELVGAVSSNSPPSLSSS